MTSILYLIFFLSILRRPLSFTLFPYTTLFRSAFSWPVTCRRSQRRRRGRLWRIPLRWAFARSSTRSIGLTLQRNPPEPSRSEEHTSELQSRPHLVCRLLLEKKKRTPKRLLPKV